MNKKEKLKELYGKLTALQNKEVLPTNEIDQLIKEEVSGLTAKLSDSPTIKILRKFSEEITKFKQDFNLQPIADSLKELEIEINENQKSVVADFETTLGKKLQEVKALIPTLPEPEEPFDSSGLESEIETLRNNLLSKQDFNDKPIQEELDKLRRELSALREQEVLDNTPILQEKIDELRKDFLSRLSSIGGGGNMNRKITVEGVDVLTKYTDINFYGVTSSVITSVNNTSKMVNIGIQGGGGSGDLEVGVTEIASGTTTRILYDNAGVLGEYTLTGTGTVVAMQTSPVFVTPTLGVATATRLGIGAAADGTIPLLVSGTGQWATFNSANNSLSYVELQNTTAGGASRTALIIGNDNNATLGVFVGNSSTYTTDGMDIASGVRLSSSGVGGLSLASTNAAGFINFYTGSNTNLRWQINSSGHLLAGTDNTYDIGASGATRPRTIYAGTSVNAGVSGGSATVITGNYNEAATSIGSAGNGLQVFNHNATAGNLATIFLESSNLSQRVQLYGRAGGIGFGLNFVESWFINSSGHLTATTDNTLDIGATVATRPRSIYTAGTSYFQNGNIALVLGADNTASTLTNNTTKGGRMGIPHYTNAEEPVAMFLGLASSGANNLYIGGFSGLMNAATDIGFYTAADITTTAGTLRWTINTAGHLLAGADNTYDIGASGATRPRSIYLGTKIAQYQSVTTAGWGVPAIYGSGRSAAQTAAVGSVATYTCGAADGSFIITSNVLVTTSSAENFTVTCAYTDEGNTARTLTLNFQLLGGVMGTAINFANGAVPYEGVPIRIRVKASTAITIATAGTFTGATYNVEGGIIQVS